MVVVDETLAPLPLHRGQTIGSHTLVAHIATGGYGTVWRARTAAGGTVAIKVLHASLVSSEEAVGRFSQEAEAIASIQHRGVVALHEVARTNDGRPYMVTELIDGRDLGALVKADGPMRPAQIADVIDQLATALDAVHRAGFVHRDIKASNIMMTEDADGPRIVLLDFGIAKLAAGDGPGLTASQFTVGTPASMAPEQIYGDAVDARTDVYGLGALIYTLTTGELPFSAAPAMLLQTLHLHGDRPRPSDVVAASAKLDAVVAKAMAQSAADRFASAREVAAALRAALEIDSAPRGNAVTKSLGISVVAMAELDALDDERVLDDYDSIFEAAQAVLEAAGFDVLRESGNAVVFAAPLTGAADAVLELLEAVRRALATRPSALAAVEFALLCHVADDRDGLLELAGWTALAQAGAIGASARAVEAVGFADAHFAPGTRLARL